MEKYLVDLEITLRIRKTATIEAADKDEAEAIAKDLAEGGGFITHHDVASCDQEEVEVVDVREPKRKAR